MYISTVPLFKKKLKLPAASGKCGRILKSWVEWLYEFGTKQNGKRQRYHRWLQNILNFAAPIDEYVRFESDDGKYWAEVALSQNSFRVNMFFPHSDLNDLKKNNVEIPPGWQIDAFEKGKVLTLKTEPDNKDRVTAFLENVFERLYQCDRDSKLHASLG